MPSQRPLPNRTHNNGPPGADEDDDNYVLDVYDLFDTQNNVSNVSAMSSNS